MIAARWKEGPDSWVWLGDKEGVFLVRSVKGMFLKSNVVWNNFVMKWSKWVPAKCNIHAWRADINRIPTRGALESKNIRVEDNLCVFCEMGVETADHLFTHCAFAAIVWEHISRWCKIPHIFSFSVKNLLELHKTVKLGEKEKEVFHGLVIVACWRIWKARNEKVYEGKEVKIEDLIGDIKSLGVFWFLNRGKNKILDWSKWCKFELM
ncbi:uncharacterized protein LOC143620614 [Bidens hawaiensis]|uniref:uncharacterized protein LOC143620614 n=1 Tax=Bidens hawaiensis TaxID=980011 RepID=UPI004049C7E4